MSVGAGEGRTTIDGLGFRYRVDGRSGAPWLVFSNSLMTDLSLWDAQVAAFGDGFRILRYDQRGHGGTDVPPRPCTFDRLVADLLALLDRCGVAQASVVGVSMGGVTALGLAASHPDRVARVAICDCAPGSTPAGAAAWDERIAVARAGGMAALAGPTLARWFRPETVAADPPALRAVGLTIARTPLAGFERAAHALQDYDFRNLPARLRCPTAFIVGAMDAALPDTMRAMAEAAPGATFTAVPEAGHLPNVERPDIFNQALNALLARRPRSPA